MRNHIIKIELLGQEQHGHLLQRGESWLLSGFVRLPDDEVLAQLAPGLNKGPHLAGLFSKVPPTDDGQVYLEFGLVLPSRYPGFEGQPEWTITVPDESGDGRTVAFSNQMRRLRYRKDEKDVHALLPAWLLADLPAELAGETAGAHVEPLRTVATTRFVFEAVSAEDAIEESLDACLYHFLEVLNRVNAAHLMMSKPEALLSLPDFGRGTFDFVYVLVANPETKDIDAQRIALNLTQAARRSRDYTAEEAEIFHAYATGARDPDRATLLLHSARSYLESGLLQFALLQLVVAAEVATNRFVNKALRAGGVSSTQLSNADRDLPYSMQLNVLLPSLCPVGAKPTPDLLGQMNRARGLRNEYMHRGDVVLDHNELRLLADATTNFVSFLEDVTARKGYQ